MGATLGVYGQVAGFEFVWDDGLHVVNNPYLNPVSRDSVLRLWREPFEGLYIPAAYSVYALEAYLSRLLAGASPRAILQPLVFHVGNMILHLGCVALIFVVLGRLVRHWWAALAGALVFSLHPLQVESVALVSETRGLLAGAMSLVAIWQYLRFAEESDPYEASARLSPGRWLHYGLGSLAFAMALLSKPAAAAVPVIGAILTHWQLGRPLRRVAVEMAPWVLLAAAAGVLTKFQQPDARMGFVTPVWARPFIAGDAVAFYLWKLVVPVRLAVDYGRTPQWALNEGWAYATWLAPCALLALVLAVRPLRPWRGPLGIFIVGLLPSLGFVPFVFQDISTVADRYAYLAMLGPALAVAVLLSRRGRWPVAVVSALVLGVLAWPACRQTGRWRNEVSLFEHALSINPGSGMSHCNLGAALLAQGDLDAAADHLERAVRIRPESGVAHYDLGLILLRQKDLPGARSEFEQAVALRPKDARCWVLLGNTLLAQGELQAAVARFQTAVEADPENCGALNNLAWLLATRQSLAGNDPARAVELARRAAKLTDNENPGLLDTLAAAYAAAGQFDQAVAAVTRAIELARTAGNEQLARELEGRRRLYRAHKPWREPD